MESLHFLNTIFAKLPSENSTGPGDFKSLNFVLTPGAKLGGHRGTWTGVHFIQCL